MSKLKLESSKHIKGEALLEAKGLGHAGSIKPFDLELHAGEVVGLAGLLGSGRTEIAQLLFGIESPDSGSITMDGKQLKISPRSNRLGGAWHFARKTARPKGSWAT